MFYDISLVDDYGEYLCSLRGFEVAKHRLNPPVTTSRPLEIVMQTLKPPIYTSLPQFSTIPEDRTELFKHLDLLVLAHARANM